MQKKKRGQGRPKTKKQSSSVTLYLTRALPMKIHKTLSAKGLASKSYEDFLIMRHSASLGVKEKIKALETDIDRLNERRGDEIEEIQIKYDQKIKRLESMIKNLHQKIFQNRITRIGGIN